MRPIRPLGSMVHVKRDAPNLRSGRLHLPENAVRAPTTGTVAAAGPDCTVQPDQRVLVRAYEGETIGGDDSLDLLISEDHILGIIE